MSMKQEHSKPVQGSKPAGRQGSHGAVGESPSLTGLKRSSTKKGTLKPIKPSQEPPRPEAPGAPPAPTPTTLPETHLAPEDPSSQASPRYQVLKDDLKVDIKRRAEGRAKVPHKYRDSIKRFFFSPTGMLKVLRMGIIIGAVSCFIQVQAPESFITITVLEVCIVLFFIVTYLVTLQHLVTWINWPLLDVMNSIISAVFLLIVAILAMQEKDRRKMFYNGGALCLAATVLCVLDVVLATRKTRNTVKTILKIEMAKQPSSAAGP